MILETLDTLLDKTVIFGYDRIGYSIRKTGFNRSDTDINMTGKHCLVTGANSGLGLATTESLAAKGANVHMVCRNEKSALTAKQNIINNTGNNNLFLYIVDISSQEQIQKFCQDFCKTVPVLDVLINNAGLLNSKREVSCDGVEMTLAVNLLAGHMLSSLLLPSLKNSKQARIINVSSGGMYSAGLRSNDWQYEKERFDGVKAYAHTKRAQVIWTQEYANQLQKYNILVFSMHPGWADTPGVQKSLPLFRSLTRAILRTSEEGADTIVFLAVCPLLKKEQSGTFWFDRKIRPTIRLASTESSKIERSALRAMCLELTGTDIH